MPRWYILRTLLYKEILRYRYNWGLLIVVIALLALSGLVAVSSRFKGLPGQAGARIDQCNIYYYKGDATAEWVAHLKKHPPTFTHRIHYQGLNPPRPASLDTVPDGSMTVELFGPASTSPTSAKLGGWKIRYWYGNEASTGMMPYRDWLARETRSFLHAAPAIVEETRKGTVPAGTETLERLPIIVASLTLFALYLLSFNLFITSTGEEREKRVLLGLLLSPASPLEVLAAKVVFYAVSSLVVALAVVGMYSPVLLLRPMLWLTILSGSVGYVAIGTVIVSVVRRQTTINTLSMLYLIVTTIVMILSQFLGPFAVLKAMLLENYLYAQMKHVVADQQHGWMPLNQAALGIIVVAWCGAAVHVFRKHATSIARAR
jgi:ABC-type multidrug transport system permease subunit